MNAPELDASFEVTMPARPYPGLRPFDEDEWPIFFGRERMVDTVVAGLVRYQCIVVHGDSGSGKSSLIRAGVLPRLRQEQARAGARWRTCIALPRGGPLGHLAQQLCSIDGRGEDSDHLLALRRLLNQGRRAPEALARAMLRDDDDHLCILIDQFEELFEFARHGGESEARLLTDFIVQMAEAPPRGLYLALTMRSEFLGACARLPGLAEAVNQRQYLLPPMSPADLQRAIREPADLYGGSVETALAERLAADAAGADGLPLVQHALMRLHALSGRADGWRLSASDYPAGGLASLLSQHADEVAQAACAQAGVDQTTIERLFRALSAVSPEGQIVRRPQPLDRLARACDKTPQVLARVIDVFRADGVSFLTARSRGGALGGEEWIDIGHEALLRCWSALSDTKGGWLVKEVRDGLIWRALLVQAESYEADKRNVLSEATTTERRRWLKERNEAWAERHGGGWTRVEGLMKASEEARDADIAQRLKAQRQRWGAVVLVVTGLIAVAGMYAQSQLALRRAQESDRHLKEVRVLNDEVQRQLAQSNDALAKLQESLDTLRQARQSGSDARLRAEVDLATGLIVAAQTDLKQGDLAPRIYLHIADESQRAAAELLRTTLAQQRIDGVPLVAPGVQRVDTEVKAGVLRCFAPKECADEAPKLAALINSLLDSPRVQVQDLSKQYAGSKVRQRHYELWLGAGELRLRPPATQ